MKKAGVGDRTVRQTKPAPKTSGEWSLDKIIAEITASRSTTATVNFHQMTTTDIVRYIFTHTKSPLATSDLHKIVSRLLGRPVTPNTTSGATRTLVQMGEINLAGIEERPTIAGARHSTPVYRSAR